MTTVVFGFTVPETESKTRAPVKAMPFVGM